jgi:hypothetical protein
MGEGVVVLLCLHEVRCPKRWEFFRKKNDWYRD